MITVIIYTKPACSLCEEAKGILTQLAARYPHRIEEVDITGDETLFDQYRYRIPVLNIAGRELAAPMDAVEVERALAAAK